MFVNYDKPESAQRAIQEVDSYVIGNKFLLVELKHSEGEALLASHSLHLASFDVCCPLSDTD